MRRVLASAPCRADLSGGTLDLWPLYLLVDRAVTVNAAVSLRAGCSVEPGGATWRFHARDGREALELDRLPARPDRDVPGAFRLAASVAAWLDLPPARIETWSDAPRGSGLGASSALVVALLAAARAALGGGGARSEEESIRVARDLEARILGLPAGSQDHLAAWHGGLNVLSYGPGGWTRAEPPDADRTAELLADALVIADTRVTHHSGMSNWEVYRAFLEGEPATRQALEDVARASVDLADLLSSGLPADELLGGIGECLEREWLARRRLAPAVSCREVDALVDAAAAAGGRAKVCGAGGGGCVVALARRRGGKAELASALQRAGGQVLSAGLDARGVEVTLS
jgi:D-glycero-alpha-D-manno-heptose-7-phosphate kinase